MIIVMRRDAKEEDIQHMIKEVESANLKPTVLRGTERTVIAVIGDERKMAMMGGVESGPGVDEVLQGPRSVQGRQPRDQVGADRRQGGQPHRGRRAPRRHRRAVLRRERGADPRSGPCRSRRPARRPFAAALQAADQPLQLPGHEGRRPQAAGQGPQRNRPRRRHGSRRQRRRADWSPNTPTCCRSAPATCRTTACSKRSANRAAGAAQARPQRDDGRVPARGRVHPRRRQPAGDALRTRHPHVRDPHALHAAAGDRALPASRRRTCRS